MPQQSQGVMNRDERPTSRATSTTTYCLCSDISRRPEVSLRTATVAAETSLKFMV